MKHCTRTRTVIPSLDQNFQGKMVQVDHYSWNFGPPDQFFRRTKISVTVYWRLKVEFHLGWGSLHASIMTLLIGSVLTGWNAEGIKVGRVVQNDGVCSVSVTCICGMYRLLFPNQECKYRVLMLCVTFGHCIWGVPERAPHRWGCCGISL